MDNLTLAQFEGQPIRRAVNHNEWLFSVVDIIGILTESAAPRKYWNAMKKREPQLSTICRQLKMPSADGKSYSTDVVTFQGALRLIQSIPSKKAEPLKLALADLAKQKLEEIADPGLGIERAVENYKKQGYDEDWIQQRLVGTGTRKELTQEWKDRGCDKPHHYMNLTALQNKETFGLRPKEHLAFKGLIPKRHNLRDHKTKEELALDNLVETVAKSLHVQNSTHGYDSLKDDVRNAGSVGAQAREIMEKALGRTVLSAWNALSQRQLARTSRRI